MPLRGRRRDNACSRPTRTSVGIIPSNRSARGSRSEPGRTCHLRLSVFPSHNLAITCCSALCYANRRTGCSRRNNFFEGRGSTNSNSKSNSNDPRAHGIRATTRTRPVLPRFRSRRLRCGSPRGSPRQLLPPLAVGVGVEVHWDLGSGVWDFRRHHDTDAHCSSSPARAVMHPRAPDVLPAPFRTGTMPSS
jgi:hypothetical protein